METHCEGVAIAVVAVAVAEAVAVAVVVAVVAAIGNQRPATAATLHASLC